MSRPKKDDPAVLYWTIAGVAAFALFAAVCGWLTHHPDYVTHKGCGGARYSSC